MILSCNHLYCVHNLIPCPCKPPRDSCILRRNKTLRNCLSKLVLITLKWLIHTKIDFRLFTRRRRVFPPCYLK